MMTERPVLDKNLDSKTFRDFYYLKEELVDFCRKNGLPVSGGKLQITDRIACFLDTGEIQAPSKVKRKVMTVSDISEDTIIEVDFICSEKHRAFFKEKKKGKTQIDKQFEYNTYIRAFFADNRGKTLEDAIKCWKYKKQLQGHNGYEQSDLVALD